MLAALIIVEPPGFNDVLGLSQRGELVYIPTLISRSSVKRFNEGVLYGFALPNEVEVHASPIGLERP